MKESNIVLKFKEDDLEEEEIQEEVADESAMFNVRQASPDGITPAKTLYSLSA